MKIHNILLTLLLANSLQAIQAQEQLLPERVITDLIPVNEREGECHYRHQGVTQVRSTKAYTELSSAISACVEAVHQYCSAPSIPQVNFCLSSTSDPIYLNGNTFGVFSRYTCRFQGDVTITRHSNHSASQQGAEYIGPTSTSASISLECSRPDPECDDNLRQAEVPHLSPRLLSATTQYDLDETCHCLPLIISFGSPVQIRNTEKRDLDMSIQGRRISIDWPISNGNLPILVLDNNENDYVDDTTELVARILNFLEHSSYYSTPFRTLSRLDDLDLGGNSDGEITVLDQAWDYLRTWRDYNNDAISQPGELSYLGDEGITSLGLIPSKVDQNNANLILPLQSQGTWEAEGKINMLTISAVRLRIHD